MSQGSPLPQVCWKHVPPPLAWGAFSFSGALACLWLACLCCFSLCSLHITAAILALFFESFIVLPLFSALHLLCVL